MLTISLKAARANKDLSLEEMAKMMDVSKSTVNRWERGITPIPEDLFNRYCEICEIETDNVRANKK